MAKRNDIHKILIIGSGPIIIGQACEFDYSGTQACKALRSMGYEIVLVNSNPPRAGAAGEGAAARRRQRIRHPRLGHAEAWRSLGGDRVSRGGVGALPGGRLRGPGHRAQPSRRGLRAQRGGRQGGGREPEIRRVRRASDGGGQEAGRHDRRADLVGRVEEADRAARRRELSPPGLA